MKFTGPPPARRWCGFEWDLWRNKFELLVTLCNLEDGVAKYEASTSMTGRAADMTRHIEMGPNDGADKVSIATFLDRLEALFSPAPGSVMAQCEFVEEAERGQRGTPRLSCRYQV